MGLFSLPSSSAFCDPPAQGVDNVSQSEQQQDSDSDQNFLHQDQDIKMEKKTPRLGNQGVLKLTMRTAESPAGTRGSAPFSTPLSPANPAGRCPGRRGRPSCAAARRSSSVGIRQLLGGAG